jgi:hypothetical protein
MADIALLNDEAFSLSSLTASINDAPFVPGRIATLGLFAEEGVTTTTVQIERDGETLALVESKPRGGAGQIVVGTKRQLIPFNTVHLPERATIFADEIQNLRAFGSETELEAIQSLIDKRLGKMRRQLDATHEFHRIGAIKGQVLDADGKSVIVDLFDRFGLKQQVLAMKLGADGSFRQKIQDLLDMIEDSLGSLPFSGVRVFCGRSFWRTLIDLDDIRQTYVATQMAASLRGDPRDTIDFGGVTWERYRGRVGGAGYIADDEAYAVPEGVPDLFITRFAPADYMEAVNTNGLPYYAKQENLRFDKGTEIEAQSNPIHLCTRPRAVIKLTLGKAA